jgi:hypothetical protein
VALARAATEDIQADYAAFDYAGFDLEGNLGKSALDA